MEETITPGIYYVGIDDPSVKVFENQYPLSHGMTYNSYLIVDDKIALLDAVETTFDDKWLNRVNSLLDGRQPSYLIVHHMEPDHSGAISVAMEEWPEMKLVASPKALTMMTQFFPDQDFSSRSIPVKEGDSLPLGAHTLTFYNAPMVHWPEVILSYEKSEKILFSADAFGKFGSLQYQDDWTSEARRYYINIVGKYGNQVNLLLNKFANLPINIIAPLHGPVLRAPLQKYLKLYHKWSRYEPETRGVLVAYASIYGDTADAAQRLAAMLRQENAGEVMVMDLCTCDQSEAVAQAFRLSEMVIAAPTYDAGIFPAMHDFLYHLTIKNYRNRRVGIIDNGSWAPIAARLMRDMLTPLPGITFVEPTVTVRSRLTPANIDSLRQLAHSLATVTP